MAIKILSTFLIAFMLCQIIVAFTTNHRVTRESPDDPTKTFNDLLDQIKTGFEDFAKNIQENQYFQNASQAVQGFAQSVEAQGKDLLEKIKKSAD